MKKFLALLLAVLVVAGGALPAFAQDVPVIITITPAVISVTVPTSLPVAISATGVVTVANDVVIENHSYAPVKVTNVTMAQSGAWALVNYDSYDFAGAIANTGFLGMELGATGSTLGITTGENAYGFLAAQWGPIAKDAELALDYMAKLPIQTDISKAGTAATVVFTVGWAQ